MNNRIQNLLKKLDIPFKDESLYFEALTHRSYLNEKDNDAKSHNERLEFLGDAVLELVITEYLYKQFPQRPEGELTSFRAAVVRTDSLAQEARNLGYGEYLMMSKGEQSTGGKDKDYLLANSFEAMLGAMYLDLGYDFSKNFVYKTLVPKIEDIVNNRSDIDAKTKFQEVAQAIYRITPIYQVISEEGPDHDKQFNVAVLLGEKEFGRGTGASKQRAEEQAAIQALKSIEEE